MAGSCSNLLKSMPKTIWIIAFLLLTVPAWGRTGNFETFDGLAYAIGTVEAIHRNTIELYDEQNKQIRSFVYLSSTRDFHKGDRVRIYYVWRTRLIEDIKKMRNLTYQARTQNLGYIQRQ